MYIVIVQLGAIEWGDETRVVYGFPNRYLSGSQLCTQAVSYKAPVKDTAF